MQALESVLDLIKQRDEITEELEKYEDWFDTLVGSEVVLSVTHTKKTQFVDCTVTEFEPGEGWVLEGEDGEIHILTFKDIIMGRLFVKK